ncbi:MAG: nucleotidyl transferase AbiEii/AbiGii toxin family protein [Syntrophomonadaceae bacterium]|nr:nucleotidyl transferase AbiEii/AbiGii toxin family protein [Syntrophomonadaceae bacterium]
MNLPTEIQILKLVITKLEELDIPYMLSGSVASSFYAQPRMTRDIDIVIELAAEQIPKITEGFSADFYIDANDVDKAVQLQNMFNIIHYQAVVKIDFIVRKDSPYRLLEFERRVKKMIADFALWVVSPEDLIISKLFWAKDSKSELQLNDVSSIVKYQAEKLDWDYIEYWVKKLGLGQLWGEIEK